MTMFAYVMGQDFTCKEVADNGSGTIAISGPVGPGGQTRCLNRNADVRTIQTALNRFTPLEGGPDPKLTVDGICGPKTNAAIWHFQKKWELLPKGKDKPDGIVDSVGPTIDRLRKGPGAITDLPAEFAARLPDVMHVLTATRAALLLARQALNRPSGGLPSLGGMSQAALERVNRHFHTDKTSDAPARFARIELVFEKMVRVIGHIPAGLPLGLAEPPGIEEGSFFFTFPDGFENWPQRRAPFWIWRGLATNAIYICPKSRTLNQAGFTYGIIHELAHFIGPMNNRIRDHAYFHKNPIGYHQLTPDLAEHNADSYSQYAFDVIGKRDFNIEQNRIS